MSRRLVRATEVSFVVAILVSELLKGDSPSPTGPEQAIATFFGDHRPTILASAYVHMLALFLFALLFAALANEFMSQTSLSGRLARLALVLVLVAFTTYVFLTSALAFGAALEAGPAVGKALWEMRFIALWVGVTAFVASPRNVAVPARAGT